MRRAIAAVLALGVVATNAKAAFAQETTHGGMPPSSEHTVAHDPDNIIDPTMHRSWREGQARWFAATTIDAGYLYLRPRGHLGYGKPFQSWLGLEVNPLVGSGGFGGYGGLRFALQWIDLRIGGRYVGAFQRAYLDPKESYNRLDLDVTTNQKARYYTLESELNISQPIGPGDFLATGSISYVGGIPDGQFVFEETLRVVVDPPWVWRARGGYVFRWGAHNQHSIGPVVDFLNVPQRDDSLTVRGGPVMRIQLSRHFDVRGSFVMPFISPDRLGLVGGDFTELGVRYRTATE
jgi:hypothetical protein